MMKRKMFTLILAVLMLVTALPLYAAADAYIPPEETVYLYDIRTAHEQNGTCKPLNTFLSNFVEMGMKEYYLDTPDEEVIACVLKHIELNANYYHGNINQITKDDGKTYMTFTQELFNDRMQHLFGRSIPAQNCPGFDSKHITVTADHYGGPIDVIASVNSCYEAGNGLYEVFFDVYYIHTDFSGWYTTAYYNLPTDNLTHRGTGRAIVAYAGGQTLDSISTSHFSLVEWQMDAWGIAGPGDNLPYGYVEETLPPETEAPTEAETAPPETEEATLPVLISPAPSFENQKDDAPVEEPAPAGGISPILLIIALVCIAVLLAVVILLLIALKKKKK